MKDGTSACCSGGMSSTICPLVRRGTLGFGWKGCGTPSKSPPRP
uniref:Cesa6 n=1 Tax=Arundo donax TaxID=35708 RepID=A0A0A9G565_ARUDO